jgi:MATE family multidrug resistance protein
MTLLSIRPQIYREAKESLRLAIPLASAQVAQSATGFVDTVMMGWLGQETLAAGGLAAITFSTLFITATGVVVSVSSLVAEAYRAEQPDRIQQVTRQGFWLAGLLALPMMIGLANVSGPMLRFGQAPTTVALAKTYLDILLWGAFPALAFAMLKNAVSALSQPRPVMLIGSIV